MTVDCGTTGRPVAGSELGDVEADLRPVDRRGAWRLYRADAGWYLRTCDLGSSEIVVDVGEEPHDPSAGAGSLLLDGEVPTQPSPETTSGTTDGAVVHEEGTFVVRNLDSDVEVERGGPPGAEYVRLSLPDETSVVLERDGPEFLLVHYRHVESPVTIVAAFRTADVRAALRYLDGVVSARRPSN